MSWVSAGCARSDEGNAPDHSEAVCSGRGWRTVRAGVSEVVFLVGPQNRVGCSQKRGEWKVAVGKGAQERKSFQRRREGEQWAGQGGCG